MKRTLNIQGLDCAHCAMTLETLIKGIEGVEKCSVNFSTQKIILDVKSQKVMEQVVKTVGFFEEVKIVDKDNDVHELKKERARDLTLILISTVFFVVGILLEHFVDYGAWVYVKYVAYGIAYLVVGYPIFLKTFKGFFTKNIFNENFLMTIASVGAMVLGEYVESVAVVLLYQVGEFLQSLAVGNSRRSIKNLVNIRSEVATKLVDGNQIEIAPEKLNVGDVILVRAGEKIPVDAVVLSGQSELDTKSITGEFLLRPVGVGDEVLSGCINAGGVNLTLKVSKKYVDSTVAKILEMVENALDKKTRTEKTITVFARYYTPIVCLLAVLIAFVVPTFVYIFTGSFPLAQWAKRALVLLVISCPCAIVISIPLAYFCSIGYSAKQGVLVKGSNYLDVLSKVKTVAFDKTGTLTRGEFSIKKVVGDKTLDYAVCAEKGSSHPISKPFKALASPFEATETTEVAGKGVICIINGKKVLVGNYKLLDDNGIQYEKQQSIATVVYVAEENECIGFVELDDELKPNAKKALAQIKKAGVKNLVLVTGDNINGAERIACELGEMDSIYSDVLPNQKADIIKQLKKQNVTAYVGDGINDVPVMTVADCALSMGKLGSSATVDASDVVLATDNLEAIANAIVIAKKTRARVVENLVFSLIAKAVFMVFGLLGVLPMWLAVVADVGVMLLAVLNSTRIKL